MKSLFRYITVLMASVVTFGCIENDIPLPDVELSIISVKGVGFTQKSISATDFTATITLDEQTDIQNVEITEVKYTDGATLSNPVVGTFDMRMPLISTLSLYQDYTWAIAAEQSIERYFTVRYQLGSATIDPDSRRVTVNVNEAKYDAQSVEVLTMKLGAADITTYSPTIENLTNFESSRQVAVSAHGRSELWAITITPIEAVTTLEVDAWGQFVDLTASGDTDDASACKFRYKLASAADGEWIDDAISADEVSSGVFTARVSGLTPTTEYQFQAYVDGGDESELISATTEAIPELPNGSFEEWSVEVVTTTRSYWNPYAEGGEQFWGSGNYGSSVSGSTSVTTPDNSVIAPTTTSGNYSANLDSQDVSIKFAAGNIFAGKFLGVVGTTNGMIAFGREFESRPLALRGWVKYNCGVVDNDEKDSDSPRPQKGDPDQGIIYVILGTWAANDYGSVSTTDGTIKGDAESPVVINTSDTKTLDRLSYYNDEVVAYGEKVMNSSLDWTNFTIELNYVKTSTKPTNIIIVASSSRYGDYFVGSTDSEMWIDELELLYDPSDL